MGRWTTRTSSPPPAASFEGVEAVCFDLDQTLVDALGAWRRGFIEAIALAAARLPALREQDPGALHDERFRPLVMAAFSGGDGDWDSRFVDEAFTQLLAEYGDPRATVVPDTVAAYHAAWPRHTHLFADALPALDALDGRYRLALITNGAAREQRLKIEQHGLAQRFGVILVSREVGIRKPDPAIFHQALAALGAPPERAVHIGDSLEHDVAGAQAAGVRSIWLNRGAASPDLPHPPPDAVLQDLTALPQLLGLPRASCG